MDVLAILFGIIFWPIAIIAWFLNLRKGKLLRWKRYVGTLLIVGIPILGATSEGK